MCHVMFVFCSIIQRSFWYLVGFQLFSYWPRHPKVHPNVACPGADLLHRLHYAVSFACSDFLACLLDFLQYCFVVKARICDDVGGL